MATEPRTRGKKPEEYIMGVITGGDEGPEGAYYFVKIDKPPNCPKSLATTLEVTFSYDFWMGPQDEYPEKDQRVRLARLREFKKGWRARWAEPITFPET